MPEERKPAPLPPLPWQLHQTDSGDVVILGATGEMVCALFGDLEYSEAIADLFCRAPALEKAAKELVLAVDRLDHPDPERLFDRLRAALENAK